MGLCAFRRLPGACLLALGMLLPPVDAAAQRFNPKCVGGVLSLYVENDLFFQTDRNYTSGIRLAWVSPDLTATSATNACPAG